MVATLTKKKTHVPTLRTFLLVTTFQRQRQVEYLSTYVHRKNTCLASTYIHTKLHDIALLAFILHCVDDTCLHISKYLYDICIDGASLTVLNFYPRSWKGLWLSIIYNFNLDQSRVVYIVLYINPKNTPTSRLVLGGKSTFVSFT